MILDSIKYIRQEGKPTEWGISGKDKNPVRFGNMNLIVGKNAAGKSRTLSIVGEIADLLAGKSIVSKLRFQFWKCNLALKENDILYDYSIVVENGKIISEILLVDGDEKYNRNENRIYSEISNEFEKLEISADNIITSIQNNDTNYPYIAEIFEWGNALKRFTFTNQYEKSHLLKAGELNGTNGTAQIDPDNIIQLFHEGKKAFGDKFLNAIIKDMKRLDYSVSEVDLLQTGNGIGISVQEEELPELTLQTDMSQGMFRALSFIIQLNLALLADVSICLLIDDMGEGLDYSRSKSLIDLLVYKINNSNIQMFITTNDRYIMNKIPIKYWSILERKPKSSLFYNYYNSKDTFDDFKYTGLNNFDFLATDFYIHGFESEEGI